MRIRTLLLTLAFVCLAFTAFAGKATELKQEVEAARDIYNILTGSETQQSATGSTGSTSTQTTTTSGNAVMVAPLAWQGTDFFPPDIATGTGGVCPAEYLPTPKGNTQVCLRCPRGYDYNEAHETCILDPACPKGNTPAGDLGTKDAYCFSCPPGFEGFALKDQMVCVQCPSGTKPHPDLNGNPTCIKK